MAEAGPAGPGLTPSKIPVGLRLEEFLSLLLVALFFCPTKWRKYIHSRWILLNEKEKLTCFMNTKGPPIVRHSYQSPKKGSSLCHKITI